MDSEMIEERAREFLAVAHEGAKKPLVAVDIRTGNLGKMGVAWVETKTALAAIEAALSARTPDPAIVKRLWEATKHGDADHQEWLLAAYTAFFSDQPIPGPRGKGNKEARIKELEAAIVKLREALEAAKPFVENFDPYNAKIADGRARALALIETALPSFPQETTK